jgi:AraC family L-rhamnose operon regulatory protein RhaS
MDPAQRLRPIEVQIPDHGVFALESYHAPGFRMAMQCHDFLEIFYVLHGKGAFHIDGQIHPCQRGDIVMVPLGRKHRIEDNPAAPLALYGLCVAPHVWRSEPKMFDHFAPGRLRISKLLAAQVWSDLRRLLFEQTAARPGSRVLVLGLTLRVLGLLARSGLQSSAASRRLPSESTTSRHQETVERYAAELPHRFFEATDLDATAAQLGMSRRRLTDLFRQVTGASWSAFVSRLRVEYACCLLKEGSRSIIATAFECGFEDLSSFYRSFKRHTGLPPRAWCDRQRTP